MRRTLTVALLAALPLLAACGDDSSDDAGDDSAAGEDSGAADGTVAIEHRFGTTEVPVGAERIVTLETQWTDVMLALDTLPVGYIDDPYVEGEFPWREGMLDESEPIAVSETDGVPEEQLMALEPDLILVGYVAEDEAVYDSLTAIAPTVPLLGDGDVDAWQDMAGVAGQMLDAEDEAQALIDDVDRQVDEVAEALPDLEETTFLMVNYVPGDSLYVVSDEEDGSMVLFTQLGLSIAPTILEEAAQFPTGRVEISLENAPLLDGDVLILFTNGADPEEIVGYDQLPAVENDAVAVLDYAEVVGLNTPTPLSVPYSLELIRPALESAAG